MRIKLNLLQLTLDRSPSVCWLHVDDNILLIRQLKEKVQKVLKETRDIELCLDNVPFLDEDDVHAINENEEITVNVNESYNFTKPNTFNTQDKESNISINASNSINSTKSLDINSDYGNESIISSIQSKSSKKRVRKRTHKKKKNEIESAASIEKNGCSDFQSETLMNPPKEPSKTHKRFKLNNEENKQQDDDTSESSDDDCLQVTREVFTCNSTPSRNFAEKNNMFQPVWRKEKPSQFPKVPVFVRGQMSTPNNSLQNSSHTENEKDKTSESNASEDCDVLVVDWKNMSPLKVSNIFELQIHDLIQFKTLSMNDSGEPALSSIITARLEHIYKTTLHIQVLSGIKEFMTVNEKFRVGEEDLGIQREVEYSDLFEIFKLVNL